QVVQGFIPQGRVGRHLCGLVGNRVFGDLPCSSLPGGARRRDCSSSEEAEEEREGSTGHWTVATPSERKDNAHPHCNFDGWQVLRRECVQSDASPHGAGVGDGL